MSEEIKTLEPRLLWENFYALTQIPRPSKKELKAALYIKEFGEKLGLETIQDPLGNVIIRKPATPGFENRKGVILQSHIDMVPQANSHSNFNFETDPIDAYVDGEWVTARETTLGADNGIGVATSLSILQSKEIKHGPIEVLVTIDEETGMTGAVALEAGLMKGDILINLDSECEEEISVGCAGGIDVNASWSFEDDLDVVGDKAYKVYISGLKGGHSGLDINLGRGNACKLMGRFLKKAIAEYGVRLSSINCGNMRNAIPREGVAIITLPGDQAEPFLDFVKKTEATWINELGRVEQTLKLSAVEVDMPELLIPEMIQDDLINAICAARNGVIRMSDSMPGIVETSTNLSIIFSGKGFIEVKCLTRGFVDSARDGIASSLESCFQLAGAKVELTGAYPGWKPNPSSAIVAIAKETASKFFGRELHKVAVHAGLECGILGSTYPNWDMMSIGPNIQWPHSPDERVQIKSVERFWDFLVKILENVPAK